MINIAIIITCFNRKHVTLKCIKKIYNQKINSNYKLKIFLTDDKSPDQTAVIVKKKYPDVNILKGDGNFYWTGGTNNSWQAALKDKISFDYYLWLNDDTFIYPKTISQLLNVRNHFKEKEIICVGSTKNANNTRSYGGLLNIGSKIRVFKNKIVMPNKHYQHINRFNGNLVLISNKAQKKIGLLNPALKHNFSDIEYGLRAELKNIKMVLCPGYQGICDNDNKNINLKDFFFGKKIISTGFHFTYNYGGVLWLLHYLSLIFSFLRKLSFLK